MRDLVARTIDSGRARRWTMIAAASVAVAAAHGMQAGWVSNQNTYLLAAADRAGTIDVGADLLISSGDPVPAFTALAAPVVRLAGGPLGIDLLWLPIATAFFAALCWIAGPRVWRRPTSLLLWTAAMSIIVSPTVRGLAERVVDRLGVDLPLPSNAIEGLAFQYALGPYVQPSIGAVLAVCGVALAVRARQLVVGYVLVASSVLLHPSFLAASLLLLVALVATELWSSSSWRAGVRDLVPAGAAATVALIAALALNRDALDAVRGPLADAASSILATERVPNHASPGRWLGLTAIALAVVVAVAATSGLRGPRDEDRRLGRFMVASGALVVLSTAVVMASGSDRLALTFPWRASVVIVPLASAFVLGQLAGWAGRLVDGRTVPRRAVVVGASFVILTMVALGLAETAASFQERPADGPLVELVRQVDPSGVGIVPTDLEDLRLSAGVPLYADWNSHPVEPAAVLEWWDRIQAVDRAMGSSSELCTLVREVEPGWVLVPDELADEGGLDCVQDWSSDDAEGVRIYWRAPQ
jgi:hypothetical protein